MRLRMGWLEEALSLVHDAMSAGQRLLVEYKPFEPAFNHTDIADWGVALHLAKTAGPRAQVLVDTGHYYAGQNIEQIVAWLIHMGMLGGFHFNDRRYADDDLTLGSIDPYQVFRTFHEILDAGRESQQLDIAFMVDQSHNLTGRMEAMVQTVCVAQELWLKAILVDREKLAGLRQSCDLVGAEEVFRSAFWSDVRPLVAEWRALRKLPLDPLDAVRTNGYMERITQERGGRMSIVSS